MAEIPTSGYLKSEDFFSDQHPLPPTEFTNVTTPWKISFLIWTPYPPSPPPIDFAGKTWIYLSGTSVG